jgi:hypothetical protein
MSSKEKHHRYYKKFIYNGPKTSRFNRLAAFRGHGKSTAPAKKNF